jgi:uroporphyrinogen-III synthase
MTEKRKMEDELSKAQRLESMGVLAGGIAHDFNNMLSSILGYASLLKEDLSATDPCSEYADIIAHAARRAAELFGARKPDWITFTSSSTVTNFVEAAGADALDGVGVASIGPVTTATARRLGIRVEVQAEKFTVEGLVEGIIGAAAPAS